MIRKILFVFLLLNIQSAFAAETDLNRELRLAAIIDDVDTVEKLLDAGANVNGPNQFGRTALMNAVENGNILTASVLLSRGANVNATDYQRQSPMKWAKDRGYKEIVELLLKYGSK